jgi:hypothetical protein
MKPLLKRLMAGLIAVAIFQVPLGYALREPDPVLFNHVRRVLDSGAELLLLGDSVSDYSTRAEPVPLLDRIRQGAGIPVGSFDGPGYTPELHLAVLEYALRQGTLPRGVVLSVNLRSFSELWDQGLQYQYSELRARLRYGDVLALGLQRPMSSYQLYATLEGYPRSEQAFQQIPIDRGGRRLGTVRDVLDRSYNRSTPEARGIAFSLLYGYSLESGHRKIRALCRIADRCRSSGIPLRLYVTPIDVDSGDRTAGPGFRSQVSCNVAVIREALAAHGAALEDWSSLLRTEQFSYQEYPNEHLQDGGRKRLAEEVIGLIGKPAFFSHPDRSESPR